MSSQFNIRLDIVQRCQHWLHCTGSCKSTGVVDSLNSGMSDTWSLSHPCSGTVRHKETELSPAPDPCGMKGILCRRWSLTPSPLVRNHRPQQTLQPLISQRKGSCSWRLGREWKCSGVWRYWDLWRIWQWYLNVIVDTGGSSMSSGVNMWLEWLVKDVGLLVRPNKRRRHRGL